MLETSVVKKSPRRELKRSVGEKCCRDREVLEKSGVEKGSVGEECWRRVFVVERFWREVLEKSVGEKCCREEL